MPERSSHQTAKTFRALGGILPSRVLRDIEADIERVAEEHYAERVKKAPKPAFRGRTIKTYELRHKLSVDERKARRVRNRLRAKKRLEAITAAHKGAAIARARAHAARRANG